MMKPPQHVKLERLIPIAAQLAAALHLGSDDLTSNDHGIRRALKTQAHALRSHKGDLPAAFKSFGKHIDATLDGQDLSVEFARAVSGLKGGLADRSCQSCCPKSQPPCSRDLPTSERVHIGGNCIAPIKILYGDIEQEVYRLWTQVAGGTQPPSLRLATGHLDIADKLAVHKDFSLTGKAQIVDNPSPMTTITVAFYDSAFDWEQFVLLPYLLIHEMVCHGFQDVYDVSGADVPRAARHSAPPTCLWSEGWMDTVSHYLATAWLKRRGALHHISNASRIRKAEQWTGEYHDARYGLEGQVLSDERHLGRQAFERVKESITSRKFPNASALDLLIRFSILLNACVIPDVPPGGTPNERRMRIVKALDVIAVSDDPARGRRIMEDFLATKNFGGLAA
jgi:hypothetical protein